MYMAVALRPHASSDENRASRDYYLVSLSLWVWEASGVFNPVLLSAQPTVCKRSGVEEYDHLGRFGHWLYCRSRIAHHAT